MHPYFSEILTMGSNLCELLFCSGWSSGVMVLGKLAVPGRR